MTPTPADATIIAQLQQQLEANEQQLRQLAATERALALAQLKIQVLEERLRQELIAKYASAARR